jgi:hypothetical protein
MRQRGKELGGGHRFESFFDQVNHDKLMNLVGRKIADKALPG